MSHFNQQLVILAVFILLFAIIYHFEHHVAKHKGNQHHLLALLAALCCHPVTIETMKNFAVHIVFFSGYVLRLH